MSYPHYPSTQLPASSYQSDHTLDMSIQHHRQISQPLILPINSAVIAHYHDVVWCAGVIQTYNVHPNGVVEYRVVFHSGDTRTVTAGKVLHKKSVRGQIMIGSRVVVEHPIRPVYMTGLIAEIPNDNNMMRYLIFLDDGSAVYKSLEKLWVVGLMDNPIDCLPSNYKMFIQKYFVDINNIKLFRYSFGDTVRVSFINNGMMQSTGKVMQVDCNIMLVKHSSSNDVEWLYLGSNRVLQELKEPDIITVQDSPQKAFPVRGNSLPAYNRQLSNPAVSNNYMLPPVIDSQPNQPKFTSPKRYIKSPLKSKGLMLSPQLDPFMFSDEDPSSVNRMSFDNYVPPVTVQDPIEPELIFEPVTPTPVSDPNRQLLGSPILILDSPDKQPRTDQLHIPHNQHHVPNNQLFTTNQLRTSNNQHLRQSNPHLLPNNQHLTSNNLHLTPNSQHLPPNSQHLTPNNRHLLPNPIPIAQTNPTFISPHKSVNGYHHPQMPQMFQQPTHQDNSVPNITIDSKAPSSFFNWSSPAVTEQPLISKDISPKVNIEFDIEDTLLTQDSLLSQDSILSQTTITRNLFCSTPPPALETTPPPRTIEQIEIIDDEVDSKAEVKPTNGSQAFPIILHQEACEADESESLTTTAVQNGNMIELVVESDVGNTIISVATPQLPATPQVPVAVVPFSSVRASRSNSVSPAPEPMDTIEPKVTRSSSGSTSTKPGKRRLLTPTKTPKLVPKITIEFDSMNKAQPAIIKKECTVQKAEKKSKRQQTKDIRERQIKSVAEIKKEEAERNNSTVDSILMKPKPAPKIKLKDMEYPSFVMKKEPIKLNSEAKISRWSNPWAKRVVGASFCKDHSQGQASAMLSGILSKLEDTDQDSDDLEEGEIDSDSEDSIVTKSDNDHTCSRLCIKALASIPSTISPLSYPFQRGWRRVISPEEEYLHYVTPCGKVKKDLPAVQEFFNSIKSFPLSINNFCFNPAIKLLNGSGELDESSEFYCPDISNGLEFVTVPLNSDVSLQKADHFKYIIDRLFEIKPVVSHLETSCNCVDNCQSEYCNCTSSASEGVRSECNNLCGCNMNCRNRVAQRGLRQLLQVRKEKDVCRVFALHDIPQGSFVCTIIGKVKKCPPELNHCVFPLDPKLYKEEEDSPVKESKVEPRLYHHSDNTVLASLQIKSEISSYSRSSDSPPYNAIWASVLSKHARLKTINISEVSAAFPSILPRAQTKAVKSKPCPSSGKVQTEYCIDCSQFGNVSRFLRSDAEYNLVIRPVLVDNQAIPWLALFSIKDILSGSELVYKDFPH